MDETRTPFIIVVSDWGRYTAVSVEPRTIDRPTQCFRFSREAVMFARELGRTEGWPIEDRRL